MRQRWEYQVEIEKKLNNFTLHTHFASESRRIGILGASGCGKSMTLKSIAGIERPDRGRICVDGNVLYDSEQKIFVRPQKRHVGYLFQNYALFPTMTVAENITAGLHASRAEEQRIVQEMSSVFSFRDWKSGCLRICPVVSSSVLRWRGFWHMSRR